MLAVGESDDGSDPLVLEPFGEAAVAERVGPAEVAAISVQGGVQPRVDDHQPRASCRMSRKLNTRQRAALSAIGRAAAVAFGQGYGAIAFHAKQSSDGRRNQAYKSKYTGVETLHDRSA